MRVRYDQEGDILSLFFREIKGERNTGLELNDNIVLYFNPDTGEALSMIIIDYARMIAAGERGQEAFPLTGLSKLPADVKAMVLKILRSAPVNEFLSVEELYLSRVKKPLADIQAMVA